MIQPQEDFEFTEEDHLQAFSHKREALENLVTFSKSMNKITKSLQAIIRIAQGKTQGKQDYNYFLALSSRINSLATEQVEEYLSNVDNKLVEDIETIIDISKTELEEIPDKFNHLMESHQRSIFHFLDEYLLDFKRRSRLSIALRIFLKERDTVSPPLNLSFDPSDLEAEINALKSKEEKCRDGVREKMVDLVEDADQILAIEGYPEAIKEKMTEIRNNLLANIRHLDAGKDIEDLPAPIMVMEMSDDGAEEIAMQELPPEEESEDLGDLPRMDVEERSIPTAIDKPAPARKSVPIKPPNFWRVLFHWLNTPFGISWQKAKLELALAQQKKANKATQQPS